MICVHRLNKTELYINHRIIETVESHPDTVITLTNERKYIVRESPEEIAEKIADFERKIFEKALYGRADTGS
ncbi:MAG TPA: flagellar protein [Leptospiraceae bacterium]|nr:flagellar protein [Spirochaetaceae bacterium]HBS04529.1 flagellar protein [Leptospiraceae bacterium]|tara:strand:+ start:13199 stop:13414 length:216 start_codon:yes stop_codon:yes gene_type:complete